MIFTEGVGRVDIRETMRYLGYYGVKDAGDMQAVIDECKDIILPVLAPVACYECYPITRGTLLDLGFAKVVSRDLEKNLSGCDKLVLFGATVGAGVDRLILKYEKLSPARSIIFQALGAAAIECWCDDLNARITAEYGKTKPRYSCGYGDLSIELQRDIFAALPLTKRLGITLSDRCFMTPTKSVTAIIGVKNDT
jgi:hypothetical protein